MEIYQKGQGKFRIYISLSVHFNISITVKAQMDSFLNGFKEVVTLKDIRSFNEAELELLISGVGTINIKDWRDNTEYKDCAQGDKVMNTLSFDFELCKTTSR